MKTNKKPAAFRANTKGASSLERRIPAKAGPRIPDIFSCSPPRVKADGNSSSVTSCGTSDAHAGALTAKPRPSTNTPTRSSIGFRIPAQPRNAKAPAHPASHKLASRSIMPALKASASAPAGSVRRKNGNDARLAIREMKRPDGDIKFIIHVAAVSCAATAVPETMLVNQILRKTRFRQALGVAFISITQDPFLAERTRFFALLDVVCFCSPTPCPALFTAIRWWPFLSLL